MAGIGEKIKETFTGSKNHGLYVIKTYMPNGGKETELENVLKNHWSILHSSGLTTGQEPLFLRNKDGRILEIFEWKDKESMDEAHAIDTTKQSWNTIMDLATLVPLASLAEANDPYPSFQLICPHSHQVKTSMAQIVCLKPHQGKENDYIKKIQVHDKTLRGMGFSTDRPVMHMKAGSGGHMINVSEWKSPEKVSEALKSDKVSSLWAEFDNIAETTRLADLPEAKERYSLFQAVSI